MNVRSGRQQPEYLGQAGKFLQELGASYSGDTGDFLVLLSDKSACHKVPEINHLSKETSEARHGGGTRSGSRAALPASNPIGICAVITHLSAYPAPQSRAGSVPAKLKTISSFYPQEFLEKPKASAKQLEARLALSASLKGIIPLPSTY